MSLNVFNFELNFGGCFKRTGNKKGDESGLDIEDIIDTLNGMEYIDKIKLLMIKICNGIYDNCILFSHDGLQLEIINVVGSHDKTNINFYNVISIPIFKSNILRYSLTLCKNNKIKNIHNNEYIKLLSGILK
jgi:hypothetical protein